MNDHELRRRYTTIAVVFYLVWVVLFVCEGFVAVRLPTHDLTTSLDRHLPVIPQFVWFYVLCYLFPFTPILVVRDWHRMNIALISVALCTLMAFVGHLALPVAFPRPVLGTGYSDRFVQFIYENDFRPGAQNFPSLHVAIAWTIYFACRRQGLGALREAAVLAIACLIIASTVLIRQHLVVDLAGGTVLAFAVWFVVARWYASRVNSTDDPIRTLKNMSAACVPAGISLFLVLAGILGYQLH